MKILIIEDEDVAVRGLKKKLKNSRFDIQVVAVLASVEESIKWLSNDGDIDLIFMDIHLKDGDCFLIFERIEVYLPIIFCTAYEEYTIKAFQVNSIDYLLKPFTQEAIDNSISKYKKLHYQNKNKSKDNSNLINILKSNAFALKESRTRFLIKVGNKYHFLNIDDIAYIYIEHKVVYAVTLTDKTLPLDYSMEDLEQILPTNYFFRINRQLIISTRSIELMINDYGRITMKLTPNFQKDVYVSQRRVERFKEWLDS